ncbi:unnamed protein product [Rhizophagus irregularis]|nr:unnamed protein product [Rhizophagus irregularis]
MTDIRKDVVYAAYNRAYSLIGLDIYNTQDEQYEFIKQTVLADESLTKDEKSEVIKFLNKDYDKHKILYNVGTKRICENCQNECLATLYCEHCVRNYLKENFLNWTSGNNDIDNLIQKCQIGTYDPEHIVEWIPHNNLQNVKYLTKGGCSEIYTAKWIGGRYEEWDSKEKQLTRHGNQNVILKELENVESANQRWFEESKSHLTISSKWAEVVKCYGLTKNPSSGNYMLVMNKLKMDLRTYLKQSYNNLIWKERIQIAYDIINGIDSIHNENAIHRDLHSGNILFEYTQKFRISDLGFCGPVDKPLNSVYGNLPYIAPEVITEKNTTFASDIYSIGILMWEISSGQLPFVNYEHNYDLAMKIVNGMRPKIVPGTPLEYKKLMEQCWDADSTKRPDAITLETEMKKLLLSFQKNQVESQNQIISNQHQQLSNYYSSKSIDSMSKNYTSKTYQFENFPEPRNATEGSNITLKHFITLENMLTLVSFYLNKIQKEEQEAFHSKPYSFDIPNNVDDFNNLSVEKNGNITKSNNVYKVFEKLEINSNYNIQNNDYEKANTVQQTKKHHLDINDDDDIYDNSNSLSEKQDNSKISNGKVSKKIKTS